MDSHLINKSHTIIGFKYRGPTKSYPRVANQLRGPYYYLSSQDLRRSISDIKKNT